MLIMICEVIKKKILNLLLLLIAVFLQHATGDDGGDYDNMMRCTNDGELLPASAELTIPPLSACCKLSIGASK